MRNLSVFASAALVIAVLVGCGDNSTSPSGNYERPVIIGIASVRTQIYTPVAYPANDLWGLPSAYRNRVPRSALEFAYARDQSMIAENPDSATKKYKLMHWAYRAWRAVYSDTVFRYWSTVEGLPGQAVFATNIPASARYKILYKMNYTNWQELRNGVDWGLVGLDSIDLVDTSSGIRDKAGWSIFSVNLMIYGKSQMFEGDNNLVVRIVDNKDTVFTKTFNARYTIQ